MEFLIPIFRLMHFIGLALLLGGTLSSVVIVKREGQSINGIKMASICTHLVAAPGLTVLLLTGLLHSASLYWENFTGAGYMHAKILVVLVLLVIMIADIKTQKKILKTQPDQNALSLLIKKRQGLAITNCVLVFIIMWLISFRPF